METRFESQSPSMLTETATSQDFLMIANSEEYTRKQVGAMIASYFEDERESQQRELIRLRELSSQQAQEIADLRSGFLRSGDTISEDTNLDIIDMSLEEDTVHNVVVAEDPFFGSP
ncbi:TMH family membrane protein [Chlamydia abortus]|nr:hypothetical protein [Chlamydia abortus]SFZ99607.1 TMH family membrane protein [Chlamydia abortus]SGA01425.1 TMH family membrane protein [Chlamydia abortus]SGA09537.1 TMH family membrane protein [Chlamydia abortus]SGA09633.1 TMH family membrane protein [Chlamydia abortus]SGA10606.1 TMH family membrane protein [Chlamydia abortus]